MEDAQLLFKLKNEDASAFKELLSVYGNRVLNTCYRFLLNREDAEDLAQDVFVEVYQSIKSFRGDSKLSTWIYRITITKCLDEIKRRNRKKRISSFGQLLHIDWFKNILIDKTSSDDRTFEKENLKEINYVLNKLPDNQRIAFTLSKMQGYNNHEIAEIMKTSTVAVESLIYRAKKRVEENLKKMLKNK